MEILRVKLKTYRLKHGRSRMYLTALEIRPLILAVHMVFIRSVYALVFVEVATHYHKIS